MKYALLASALGVVAGAGAGADPTALPGWAQFGILGVIILALVVTKQLVAGWVYVEVKTERDNLKLENKELIQQLISTQRETLPVMQSATSAIEDAMEIVKRYGGK